MELLIRFKMSFSSILLYNAIYDPFHMEMYFILLFTIQLHGAPWPKDCKSQLNGALDSTHGFLFHHAILFFPVFTEGKREIFRFSTTNVYFKGLRFLPQSQTSSWLNTASTLVRVRDVFSSFSGNTWGRKCISSKMCICSDPPPSIPVGTVKFN